jgi:hypothetical protein
MLKNASLMKKEEFRAAEVLRNLLEKIPGLYIESIEVEAAGSHNWEPDFVVRVLVNDVKHLLICEYKLNGQPRYARAAVLNLRNHAAHSMLGATPVLIAPYLSPAVKQMCEEQGIAYLDLEGNARISFGTVFIERVVADRPVVERRELRSLFSPKSAQVLRTLLRDPTRAWRVTELSERAGVSLGHVSNVRTGLVDKEWARISDDGLVLSAPDALLDAWQDVYTQLSGKRLGYYTPLHGKALVDAARDVMGNNDGDRHVAFASFSAAQWLAPYGRTGTHYFIADDDGFRKLQAALMLAPISKGENVVVTFPKDLGLLIDTVEPAPGAVCTSPVQTYLDLSTAGERGAEAADYLRKKMLSWPK